MHRGRPSRLTITLTPPERAALERWRRARRLPAGQARRARCVLLRAAGVSIRAIAHTVGTSRKAVYAALRAFQAGGLAGLPQRRRGRRPGAPGP